MKFYYGADKLVEKPIYGQGKTNNDYGSGFYLTKDKDIARLWASRYKEGYLITYEVDISKMKVLYLDKEDNISILKWITLLVNHRFNRDDRKRNNEIITILEENFLVNIDNYDMIVGYRADDSFFRYSKDFVSGNLSIEALSSAMKLGNLGKQYVLVSKDSFNHIKMMNYEKINKDDSYEEFRNIKEEEYKRIKEKDSIKNNTIREILKNYVK